MVEEEGNHRGFTAGGQPPLAYTPAYLAETIHGARGDTKRAHGTFTIPLSTVRAARRLMREGHGGRPRLTPWRGTDAAPHRE